MAGGHHVLFPDDRCHPVLKRRGLLVLPLVQAQYLTDVGLDVADQLGVGTGKRDDELIGRAW